MKDIFCLLRQGSGRPGSRLIRPSAGQRKRTVSGNSASSNLSSASEASVASNPETRLQSLNVARGYHQRTTSSSSQSSCGSLSGKEASCPSGLPKFGRSSSGCRLPDKTGQQVPSKLAGPSKLPMKGVMTKLELIKPGAFQRTGTAGRKESSNSGTLAAKPAVGLSKGAGPLKAVHPKSSAAEDREATKSVRRSGLTRRNSTSVYDASPARQTGYRG